MTETVTAIVENDSVSADSSARVPWWCLGKVALAAAALVLVSDGRLALDEPVGDQPYTLRHLLQHRAGLPDYGALPAYRHAIAAGETPWPVDELFARINVRELQFAPGHQFAYSNAGYLIVRQLIEQVTDAPLGVALNRLVFAPLGIGGVTVATDPATLNGTLWTEQPGYHPGWVYHGLLTGSAGSAALFLDRLLAGRLLPAPMLAAMGEARPVASTDPARHWRTAGYGLGLMVGEGHIPLRDANAAFGIYVGHTGAGTGSVSAMYRYAGGTGPRTAAVFARGSDVGAVERLSFALAAA